MNPSHDSMHLAVVWVLAPVEEAFKAAMAATAEAAVAAVSKAATWVAAPAAMIANFISQMLVCCLDSRG